MRAGLCLLALLVASSCTRSTAPLNLQLGDAQGAGGVGSSASSSSGTGSGSSSGTIGSATLVRAPVIASFQASSNSVSAGQPVTLSWAVQNVAQVTILPPVALPTGGTTTTLSAASSVTIIPSSTISYGIFATNDGGSTSAVVIVNVGSDGGNASGAPTIASVVPGPTSEDDYFRFSTTFHIVGSNLSAKGDNQVVSNCPGGGLNAGGDPNSVQKTIDAPATDGSGNVDLTVEFAIPDQAETCTVLVTRPDGVAARPFAVQPFWLADNVQLTLNTSNANLGLDEYQVANLAITDAPASTPVWLGWYWSSAASAGGQALFNQVATDTTGTTDANGNFAYTFGGCNDVRDNKGGGYYLVIVIGHDRGEIYYPINGGSC